MDNRHRYTEDFLKVLRWFGKQFRRIVKILLFLVALYLVATICIVVFTSVKTSGLFSVLLYGGFFLFVATFFISRYGAKQLTKIRLEYFAAIGRDVVPKPPKKETFQYGMLVLIPFNFIWFIVALLIPLGSGTAWLMCSLPSYLFSWFQFVFVKEKCKDLDVKLTPWFLTETGIYLLSVLLGVLLLVRAEG